MTTRGTALTGLLLGALLLTGCAGSTPGATGRESTSPNPSGSPSGSPSPSEPSMSTGGPVQEPTVVAMVMVSDAGGRVATSPVPVGDAAALRDFSNQFRGEMPRKLSAAARGVRVPDGQTLLAAVVDLSCEPPLQVEVTTRGGGVVVEAAREKSMERGRQCLVPVTTVALVTAVV